MGIGYLRVFSIFVWVGLSIGCRDKGRSFVPDLDNYNTADRETMTLDKELLEISGMWYMPGGKIAAINDEDGKIFLVNSSTGKFTQSRFGRKRDYEDIVSAGNYFFVLESNGNIHRIPLNQPTIEQEFEFPREKRVEFESVYYDPHMRKLVMLSKEQREAFKDIHAYSFDPELLQFSDTPIYRIPAADLHRFLKDYNAEFKPSAASVHPITGKLFTIASEGKALLESNLNGKIEKAWFLNPDQFPQPEGLTFAPNGDLFISNEGVDGKATILKFPYRTQKAAGSDISVPLK